MMNIDNAGPKAVNAQPVNSKIVIVVVKVYHRQGLVVNYLKLKRQQRTVREHISETLLTDY